MSQENRRTVEVNFSVAEGKRHEAKLFVSVPENWSGYDVKGVFRNILGIASSQSHLMSLLEENGLECTGFEKEAEYYTPVTKYDYEGITNRYDLAREEESE